MKTSYIIVVKISLHTCKNTMQQTNLTHLTETVKSVKSVKPTKPTQLNQTSSEKIEKIGVLSDNDYNLKRNKMITDMKSNGTNPYPHKFNQTLTISQFIDKYGYLQNNELIESDVVSLTGRVKTIKESSKKLCFLVLTQGDCSLQFMISLANFIFNEENDESDENIKLNEFCKQIKSLSRGDIIGATGFPTRTKTGELSLMLRSFKILTPCLKIIPSGHFGLADEELRQRKRYLDLLVNNSSKAPFKIRTKVIKFLRDYLDSKDFYEVQTPILTPQAGGAIAKPFMTFHNDCKKQMALRIAPELYLKQLVVGGFDRVYELGNQFRNESIDRTHSPEFTSLEFYMAYADYNDLIKIAEEIFSGIAYHIHGSYKIKCKPFDSVDDTEIEVDFTPPFAKYDFLGEIETGANVKLPNDLSSEETRLILEQICKDFNVECSNPRTNSRMLDKLAGHFIEPKCKNPSFIINHPLIMSPLAKWHRDDPRVTERFELFMLGYEFANAYTELNDPQVQRFTFEEQAKAKANGDDEAQGIDEQFLDALEYGLPPTGGFGIGIDRLVMLMAGVKKIQDVIFFPTMR